MRVFRPAGKMNGERNHRQESRHDAAVPRGRHRRTGHRAPGRAVRGRSRQVGADRRSTRRCRSVSSKRASTRRTEPSPGTSRRPTCRPHVRREVKIAKGAEAPKLGDQVLCSMFAVGRARRRHRHEQRPGFQGTVKRHHFRGGDDTHGSMFHRAPGSIGPSSYSVARDSRHADARAHGPRPRDDAEPQVLRVDAENNVIVVRGAVPGANGGYVLIRKAVASRSSRSRSCKRSRRRARSSYQPSAVSD